MAQNTQNGIIFNSYKDRGGQIIGGGPIRINGQQGPDEYGGIINAVDIDWNDADFISAPAENPVTISTFGDLINPHPRCKCHF